jgi:hypothetical protein
MEWDPFLDWGFGYAPHAGPDPARAERRPSALDLWLVRLAYGVIVGELECQACGARLSGSLRLTPMPTTEADSSLRVSIRARCGGWRHHRHYADAVLGPDLLLGAFARSRARAWPVTP